MKHNFKYVFFGTPDFAAVILEKLIKTGWPPLAIVCNPDRPIGRKKIITPPPTKQVIVNCESEIRNKIKILQPEKLDKEIIDSILKISDSFDFFIVAAYAKIIPKEILTIPRLGVVGVHPSLLPKHRGPSPIQSAILNGDSETGVSLFLIDEEIDHGSIFAQQVLNCKLETMNYRELSQKLAELGGDLLIETLPKFIKSETVPLTQNENKATFTKKFITEDGYVDLQKDEPIAIERKIRALNPEPGVYTTMEIKAEKKRVKLLKSELVDGKLKLTKIQIEGGKPQDICRII